MLGGLNMEGSMRGVVRKLNTQGCCFLCLEPNTIKLEVNGEVDETVSELIRKETSMRCLTRYLKVNLDGMEQATSSATTSKTGSKPETDFKVDLCESCEKLTRGFLSLFQQFERIQLEMDYFLERIHRCISQSAKSPELVENYSKRMTSDLAEVSSELAIVNNLRTEVSEKCLKKMNATNPRLQVILSGIDNVPIKTENLGESSDGDYPGNFESSPPSPNSTEVIKKTKIKLKNRESKYFTENLSTGMYECKKCDKKSKCATTIARHFKTDHLKLRYKCDICNVAVLKEIASLRVHKRICAQKAVMENYSKRMTSDLEVSTELAVNNLRKEVSEKCLKKMNATSPSVQVILTKADNVQIKTENLGESSDGDPGNVDSTDEICIPDFASSPSPSPNSTEVVNIIKLKNRESKYFTENLSTGMYECKKCDKKSKCSTTIARHFKSDHLKLRYKCDICNVAILKEASCLRVHKRTCAQKVLKTEKTVDLCESSDGGDPGNGDSTGDTGSQGMASPTGSPNSTKGFKIIKQKKRESQYWSKNLSTGMYECKKCDKSSKTPKTIADHYKSVHLKLRYKCDICNFAVLKEASSLRVHKRTCAQKVVMELAKEIDPKCRFICKDCGKRFNSKLNLGYHTRNVHKNANRYQCGRCDKKYTCKSALRRHQAAIHGNFGTEALARLGKYYTKQHSTGTYRCKQCDKESKSSQTIVHHFKTVHLKIKYKCDICNVSDFTTFHHLNFHKKTCREKLERAATIEREKQNFEFICDECGKMFETKHKVDSHRIVVHKNIGRYPCDLCDKKFKKSCNLKSHRDAVHFGKRYPCGFCSRRFSYQFALRKHERECPQKLALNEEAQEQLQELN